MLAPLAEESDGVGPSSSASSPINYHEILAATKDLLLSLTPNNPIYAAFHDDQVHDPLGAGAYAFRHDLVEPILLELVSDELLSRDPDLTGKPPINVPTRPIIIHAGAQPNNSPHCGTLVVFCYAFAFARAVRDRLQAQTAGTHLDPPPVSVEITFVDTAPVDGEGLEINGIQYQKSYRDVPGALETYMGDYQEVLSLLSTWSSIPFTTTFQSHFFSHPSMPSILRYVTTHHLTLGRQLSPKHGKLALRAACPVAGCSLAEKHGRLNTYHPSSSTDTERITLHCPRHGPHTIRLTNPREVARLEANAPTRNLLRSMSQLLDTRAHHVRVTGADYAGTYQEALLLRPLAAGAKLSKSLYVREGGYDMMKVFGTDGLCSYRVLKERVGGGAEGLRRVWKEMGRWMEDPKRLSRAWSVEYLAGVVMGEKVEDGAGNVDGVH
ncbi:hypothetical protein N656DRAFT_749284 [Canariomyces notabilis]|uniref:Uncharacterized protein n=1 Tax=Canariomyces notabilis TaxID=2074819 RepID=A0AAN6YUY8_9PEZI|nr:hypothetical protein N656DRAFT_749284 [Canariomyces arenarius]